MSVQSVAACPDDDGNVYTMTQTLPSGPYFSDDEGNVIHPKIYSDVVPPMAIGEQMEIIIGTGKLNA